MRTFSSLALLLLLSTQAFADEVFVQLRFKEQTEVGEYNDAIYFSEVAWANRDQAAIDAEKAQRVANFVEAVKNPPPPVEPTKEELEFQKVELEKQIEEINNKLNAIEVGEVVVP